MPMALVVPEISPGDTFYDVWGDAHQYVAPQFWQRSGFAYMTLQASNPAIDSALSFFNESGEALVLEAQSVVGSRPYMAGVPFPSSFTLADTTDVTLDLNAPRGEGRGGNIWSTIYTLRPADPASTLARVTLSCTVQNAPGYNPGTPDIPGTPSDNWVVVEWIES